MLGDHLDVPPNVSGIQLSALARLRTSGLPRLAGGSGVVAPHLGAVARR